MDSHILGQNRYRVRLGDPERRVVLVALPPAVEGLPVRVVAFL